jgi:hypothetical protein
MITGDGRRPPLPRDTAPKSLPAVRRKQPVARIGARRLFRMEALCTGERGLKEPPSPMNELDQGSRLRGRFDSPRDRRRLYVGIPGKLFFVGPSRGTSGYVPSKEPVAVAAGRFDVGCRRRGGTGGRRCAGGE